MVVNAWFCCWGSSECHTYIHASANANAVNRKSEPRTWADYLLGFSRQLLIGDESPEKVHVSLKWTSCSCRIVMFWRTNPIRYARLSAHSKTAVLQYILFDLSAAIRNGIRFSLTLVFEKARMMPLPKNSNSLFFWITPAPG